MSKVNRTKSLDTRLDKFSNGLNKFSNSLELNSSLDPWSFRESRIEFRVSSFEGLSTYLWAVLYVNKICCQPMKWQPDCSQRAIRSSREFHSISHTLLYEVQHALEMGKTKINKKKRPNSFGSSVHNGPSIIVFRRRSWIVRIWEVFTCTRDRLHFILVPVFLIN